MLNPAAIRERLRTLGDQPAGEHPPDSEAGDSAEVYEAVRRDEDRL
jgi:hypothetical protein